MALEKRELSMIASLSVQGLPVSAGELIHSLGVGVLELNGGQPLNNTSLQKSTLNRREKRAGEIWLSRVKPVFAKLREMIEIPGLGVPRWSIG